MTNPVDKTMHRLLVCGAITPPLLAAFIIAAVLVTPGYSYVSEGLSQLGARGQPHPEVINAGFTISGLLIFAFAYSLRRRLGDSVTAKTTVLLLMIVSICMILSGVFRADLDIPGTASTAEGNQHKIFAATAYFAFLTVMAVFAIVVRREEAWRSYTQMTLAVIALSLVVLLILILKTFPTVEGALQLTFVSLSLIWLEAISLRSLRLPAIDVLVPVTGKPEAELAASRTG